LVGYTRLRGIPVLLVIALFLSTATLAVATPVANHGKTIRLLVSFDPHRVSARDVELSGGRVVYVASLAPVMIVDVDESIAPKIASLPGILHVSVDQPVKVMADTVPWGVSYIRADQVWSITTGWVDVNGDGNGEVEVAVIDTGVDVDHPDLAGNIKWCVSVLNGVISSNCNDGNGHGTHVIGTIAALANGIGVVGVAPRVEVYAIKALRDDGSGSYSDIIMAIDLAVKGPDGVIDADGDGVIVGDPQDDAPEVISMSLGGYSDVPQLKQVIQAAYSWGITIVAAAGNEGYNYPAYPAAYPEVIAVGAVDSSGNVPSWSNRYPEVAAPGVNILSTYPDNTYATLSGTSMATPHVSATVALIQAARLAYGLPPLPPGTEGDLSINTIRGILHITAVDKGAAGYDKYYGYGVIDAYAAVTAAVTQSVQLLKNPGFDTDTSYWTFYKGTYIKYFTWLSSYNGASGVAVMYGYVPAYKSDWAFLGQSVIFPTGITSGTIEIKYYARAGGGTIRVLVGIYDTVNGAWVWYTYRTATLNTWQTWAVSIPSDYLSLVAGGQYLFVIGFYAYTTSSRYMYLYIDYCTLTVQ